jgi:hypothetical protein
MTLVYGVTLGDWCAGFVKRVRESAPLAEVYDVPRTLAGFAAYMKAEHDDNQWDASPEQWASAYTLWLELRQVARVEIDAERAELDALY